MINGISLLEDQQELVAKANAAIGEAPNDGATYGRRGADGEWVAVPTTPGGSTVAWVDITGKPATFPPTVPIAQSDITGLTAALAGKEPTITAGTSSQYWRGDKSFQTLDKAAVGLGNVDNTSDANKPVSTAQAAAIAAKVSKAGDSMTGNLAITAVNPTIVLNKTAGGQDAVLYGQTAGVIRWALDLANSATESGGNLGSDFGVNRYNDAGSFVSSPFSISRATGIVTMPHGVSSSGEIVSGQNFRAAGAAALLATNSAGQVILRPNGVGSASGQAFVNSDGTFSVAGTLNSGNGFIQSLATNAILAGNGGAVYLRPYGVGNTTGESYLDTGGNLHATIFQPVGAAGGFRCRYGGVDVAGSNVFNFWWDGGQLQAYVDGSNVGTIPVPCDHRIKKDVADLPSTWDAVRNLRPVKYTQAAYGGFVADDKERWGFIAHELQETLVESAANGVKDGETLQSPNPWTLIAALTRTVQEMQARIEALEGKT